MSRTIGIVLFDDSEELDWAGPWEVLAAGARDGDRVVTVGEALGPIRCAKGLRVLADHTFDDCPTLDVILVPGGIGSRAQRRNEAMTSFVARQAAHAAWTTSNERGWGTLQMTTKGRRSGRDRSVIVGYLEDGPNLVTLAMNGWQEGHPSWWLNLESEPTAHVRLPDGEQRRVVARAATGSEHDRLLQHWRDADPNLLVHADHRATTTPVVVLTPG